MSTMHQSASTTGGAVAVAGTAAAAGCAWVLKTSGGASGVAMMESTDPRQRDHPAATGRQHGPRRRRVLVERDMRAVGVVVGHVLARQVVGEERAQVCEGGWNRRGMMRDTVASLTTKPSLSSSPWMRGAPQPTLSRAISRMRVTRFYYVSPCARATLATTTTSSSGSIGLTTCALNPAEKMRTRSSVVA